ncbi:MAG: MFS transporter [bacterium]|nr:MFS transporter [bacterium]MCP4968512.1 MFS transporter [bacterium]
MPFVEPPDLSTLRNLSGSQHRARPIVWGQAVSLLGDYVAYVTVPLFMVHLTGRGLDLGLTAAAETIPTLLFGFTAGVFLDRFAIKPILIGTDLLRALAFVLLAIGAAGDSALPWMVFLAAFVVGSLATFFNSGLEALLPSAIPEEHLVTINSHLALARTTAFALGPALGGILISVGGGFPVAFLANAATFLVSAALLAGVRVKDKVRVDEGEPFLESLRSGVAFLLHHPQLRWVTLGAAIANLVFAPLEALLFLFVPEYLGATFTPPAFLEFLFADEALVGLFIGLQATVGSAMIFMGPRIAKRAHLGRMFAVGLFLFGGGFLVMAFSNSFWGFIPAGIGVGGVGFANIAIVTMRQRLAPPEMLGRVVAASRTIAWSLIPIGAALGGAIADWIGLLPIYLMGGAGVIVTAIAVMRSEVWSGPTLTSKR